MQSFFGKIDFVRKIALDFAETVKPLQKMIHKYVEFKWDEERKGYFNNIKTIISQALVLRVGEISIFDTLVKWELTN
jgi:hypothetical protein